MNNKTTSTVPLWFSLIVFGLLTAVLMVVAMQKTNGHFGYPLDDTYIHMAMAKNFALYDSWGINQDVFSSTTSSPLWTLLIAITYMIFGINDWVPFLLSLILSSLTIYSCYWILRDHTNSLRLLLLLILLLLLVPLPIMALTGMEHSLQGLVTLLLLYLSSKYVSKNEFAFKPSLILIMLANLTTFTRYEGIFVVFAIALLLVLKKRFWESIVFVASSLSFVTIYGFISIANDGYFLPNSVLLKGNTESLTTLEGAVSFFGRTLSNLQLSPHVAILLVTNLILYLWLRRSLDDQEKSFLVLSVIMTFAHMAFASVGWFFRYEAYIVLILTVILISSLNKYVLHQLFQTENSENETLADKLYYYGAILGLTFLFLIPLAMRTGLAFQQYPFAVTNIYEQQYQMGLFLREYYPEQCVAANDIGAINYLAEICTTDLYGLANMEVLKLKQDGSYTKSDIRQLTSRNEVQIAVIYNSWFEGQIPDDWVEIGQWQIADNVICASDVVSFYATNDAQQEYLTSSLLDFSDSLPPSITESGLYMRP